MWANENIFLLTTAEALALIYISYLSSISKFVTVQTKWWKDLAICACVSFFFSLIPKCSHIKCSHLYGHAVIKLTRSYGLPVYPVSFLRETLGSYGSRIRHCEDQWMALERSLEANPAVTPTNRWNSHTAICQGKELSS